MQMNNIQKNNQTYQYQQHPQHPQHHQHQQKGYLNQVTLI